MTSVGWIILIIVNVPVYIGLGWVFFRSWENFWESIRYKFTPDIISLFRGEFWDDWWAETKFGLWVFSCVLCVIGEILLIEKILG